MKLRIFSLLLVLALLVSMLPAAFAAGCGITVAAPEAKTITTGALYTLPLADVFTDPNGHAMTYTYTLTEGAEGTTMIALKDGVLSFTAQSAGSYSLTVTAACEGGGSASAAVRLTVEAASQGDESQYDYDETNQSSVRVYVTISNDGAPLLGSDGTVLAYLAVDVPYFPLESYGLSDYNRYHTRDGSGGYIDDRIVERPTALHLYIYLLERYYLGIPESGCGKGTSGLLEYTGDGSGVADFLNGSYDDTGKAALEISGSSTSMYMHKFWGHDENLMYYRNHVYPLMGPGWGATADYILLSDGDTIDVALFSDWNFWNDGGAFTCFDKDGYAVTAGEALTLKTLKYDTKSVSDGGSEQFDPINSLSVRLYNAGWEAPLADLNSENGDGTYTFDTSNLTPGVYYLLGLDNNVGTADARLAPATAKLTVLCSGEHTWDGGVTLRESTCAQEGVKLYTCKLCGTERQETTGKTAHTVVTDAAVEPTCTKTGLTEGKHCSVCKTIIVEQKTVPANGHTEVTDAAVPATCTESGLTEGSHCSVCNTIIKEQKIVAANGHTEVTDAAVPATCTESGLTEGKHCSVCSTIIKKQETVPAKGHTEVTDAAVPATCTESGLTEGSHCSVCNTIIKKQETVPALGHRFEKGVCAVCGAKDPNYVEPETPWVNPFKDVRPSDWFYAGVKFANENALFNGTEVDTFSPEQPMTRAMLVTVLWRLDGRTKPGKPLGFVDVPAKQYYAEPVAWAAENGIVNGTDATHFAPNDEVTREQIAAILYRYATKKGVDTTNRADLSAYPDAGSVSGYAREALAWANAAGLIQGTSESGRTYLAPQASATRAQVATILARYAQSIVK